MNKKSTLRSVANDYLTHPKGNGGITLIALVITIVLNSSCLGMERIYMYYA